MAKARANGIEIEWDSFGERTGKPILLVMPLDVPYSLDDMADDAVGRCDALRLGRVHVVGASMGGMIAQTVAYRHPNRVKSLVSIMSTGAEKSLFAIPAVPLARRCGRHRVTLTRIPALPRTNSRHQSAKRPNGPLGCSRG
jgi:pimeloyl-ACP methyl ester carboxylesterase